MVSGPLYRIGLLPPRTPARPVERGDDLDCRTLATPHGGGGAAQRPIVDRIPVMHILVMPFSLIEKTLQGRHHRLDMNLD